MYYIMGQFILLLTPVVQPDFKINIFVLFLREKSIKTILLTRVNFADGVWTCLRRCLHLLRLWWYIDIVSVTPCVYLNYREAVRYGSFQNLVPQLRDSRDKHVVTANRNDTCI